MEAPSSRLISADELHGLTVPTLSKIFGLLGLRCSAKEKKANLIDRLVGVAVPSGTSF